MNDEEFQQRVAGTPLRSLPSEWRAEILGVATAAGRPLDRGAQRQRKGWPWARGGAWLPAPWVTLAGAWGVTLLLHGMAFDAAVGEGSTRPTSGVALGGGGWAAARAYQAEVLALVNSESPDSDENPDASTGRPDRRQRPRTQWVPPRPERKAA